MNILLKPYQTNAVAQCRKEISRSVEDWDDSKTASAVSLSAFTSAGKTIIATALIERLRFGDGALEPSNPNLTVLWVTNSPSLNKQTRMKMEGTSSRLTGDVLHDLNKDIDGLPNQPSLSPGKVYFLNTQMLAKTASSYRASEGRPVGLQQMIRNTVNSLGQNFLMIIDEAHIGTRKDERGGQPIAYRLINGDESGFGRFPVVLGLSATPQRFTDGIKGSGRALRSVEVPVREIRESGLIKDRLLAHVPMKGEYAESTLLRQAVKSWRESDKAWSALHKSDKAAYPLVHPLLLVQVEPGITDERLASLLRELREADPELDGTAVAHAFGEGKPLVVGGTTVDYIGPEQIQDKKYVRLVLFKDALTTGWDCPRAEVLISLRTARDMTYVKQMIGRMVRTPLAMRVDDDDFLNDVTMYLPHYDMDTIEQVKKDLNGTDSDDAVVTEVISNPVDVFLIDAILGVEDGDVLSAQTAVYERMRQIKTHPRPKRRRGPVPRLSELAQLLASTGLLNSAQTAADKTLAAAMMEVHGEHKDAIEAAAFDRVATKVNVVDLGDGLGGVRDLSKGDVVSNYSVQGMPSGMEVQAYFDEARRLCGSGPALEEVWKQLAGEDPSMARFDDPDAHVDAQLIATEIGLRPEMRDLVNTAAEAKFESWTSAHGGKLALAASDTYADLMAAAGKVVPTALRWPKKIVIDAGSIPARAGHIYVDTSGEFPLKKDMNSWEAETLTAMAAMPGLIGWWRNGTGGEHSLGVRYVSTSGEHRTMYPDFMGLYEVDGKHQFVLFDPHADAHDGQSRTKWLGLAQYLRAAENVADDGTQVVKTAWAIIRPASGGALRGVDLADDGVMASLEDPAIDLESQLFAGPKGFTV